MYVQVCCALNLFKILVLSHIVSEKRILNQISHLIQQKAPTDAVRWADYRILTQISSHSPQEAPTYILCLNKISA